MRQPAILVVDNYDSFTFMLVDRLAVAGANVTVKRADMVTVEEALAVGREGIVVSPGPGHPEEAGVSVALARACVDGARPFLGVCLGHQALVLACGGQVVRTAPVHGKIASVSHDGSGLFDGLPSPVAMTRYHSLAATGLPETLVANAWTDDGTVMAIRHVHAPVHGVQFHPESVGSQRGDNLLARFVERCRNEA